LVKTWSVLNFKAAQIQIIMIKKKLFLLLPLALASALYGQDKRVTGVVKDESGDPVIGANVVVKGSGRGVATDARGSFELIAGEKDTLVVTFIGLSTQKLAVAGKSNLDIMLSEGEQLKDVIITALGIEKSEAALGYASQQISGKEAVLQGNPNALAGIDGKISGVQVVQASGTPGASAQIMIRGISSVSNSEPLIVVDGVPISNESKVTRENVYGTGGTDRTSRAVDINPEDIESMTVLKGPAAAVLYGSRAQNGVIVYTTKKGKAGGLSVNFSTSVGMDFVRNLPKMQTKYGQGYMNYNTGNWVQGASNTASSALYVNSWGPEVDGQDYSDPLGNTYSGQKYNNLKDFFQIGVNQNYNLSLQGGTDKVRTIFSLGYSNITGTIPNNTFTRLSLRNNTTAQLSDRLTLEVGANLVNTGGNKSQKGSNSSGATLPLYRMPINFDGKGGKSNNNIYNPTSDNPFWSVNNILRDETVWRFVGSTKLSYDLDKHKRVFDALKLSYSTSVDLSDYEVKEYVKQAGSNNPTFKFGRVQEARRRDIEMNHDVTLAMSKHLPEDFSIDFVVGFNFRRNTYTYLEVAGTNTADFNLHNISAMSEKTTEQVRSEANFLAAYADFTASWKNTVYLGLALRSEWASALPYFVKRNRQGYQYPAVNASFVFTELSENKRLGALSFGKVRASFGVTGLMPNAYSGISPIQQVSGVWDPSIGNNPSATNNGSSIISYDNVYQPSSMVPERKMGFELGTDLRFFNGRLTLDATIYQDQVTGSLLSIAYEPASGFRAIYGNNVDLRNRGVELTLGGSPVVTHGFEWNTAINVTHNQNIVTKIKGDIKEIGQFGFSNGISNYIAEGKPAYALYGYTWKRNEDGQILTNDKGKPIVVTEKSYLGNPFPKVLLGWNNKFTYKGLSLSVFAHIRIGGDMHNGTLTSLNAYGKSAETEDRLGEIVFAGVNETTGLANDIAMSKVDYYRDVRGQLNEQAIEKDIHWIKLRDVTLAYTWNIRNPKYQIKSIGLSVSGSNLAMWSNYSGGMDPETSLGGGGGTSGSSMGYEYFNNPNVKSVLFGLKLNL